jgi:hypothetical protein
LGESISSRAIGQLGGRLDGVARGLHVAGTFLPRFVEAYLWTYDSARSRAGARASTSRLMKRRGVRSAMRWFYAQANNEIPPSGGISNRDAASRHLRRSPTNSRVTLKRAALRIAGTAVPSCPICGAGGILTIIADRRKLATEPTKSKLATQEYMGESDGI